MLVLALSKVPYRRGGTEHLACGPCGICSGKLLSSAAAAVSGYKCCRLVAVFYTNKKHPHTGHWSSVDETVTWLPTVLVPYLDRGGNGHRCVEEQAPVWLRIRIGSEHVSGFFGPQHSHPTSMTNGGQTEHMS